MIRAFITAALFLAAALVAAQAPAPKDETIGLRATAHHSEQTFKKFLYSWTLPKPVHFTGISGTLATQASRSSFNEALMSVRWIPGGTCPQNGEVYDTYQQIKDRYPGSRQLLANILKSPALGETTVPVDFKLPGGVRISHCVYVILDGSTLTGGDYKMTSDLVMHYTSAPPSDGELKSESFGDEFCFGMEHGCGASHTTSGRNVFMTFFRFQSNADTTLVAVQGNTSSSAMTPDLVPRSATGAEVASGRWSVASNLYILNDCRNKPTHTIEADDYNQVLAGAVPILNLTSHSNGIEAAQEQVHWRSRGGALVPKDGCLVHLGTKSGVGAVNTEFQVTLFTRRDAADTAPAH